MALDVGSRRVGVALAHRIARLPSPLATIERGETTIEALRRLIEEHKVGALVVGWPRGLQGQATDQTKLTEMFVGELKQAFDIPVYLIDEALTSVQAEVELGGRARVDKAAVDALAATYILDDFLRNHPEVLA